MKIKNLISNIILVILLIILAIAVILCISEIRSYHDDYYMKEDSFLYTIQEKDYPRLIEISKRSRVVEGQDEELSSFHAVADYFEAAIFYKAYLEIEDGELAKQKKVIMDENIGKMGEFSYLAEEILEELDLVIE